MKRGLIHENSGQALQKVRQLGVSNKLYLGINRTNDPINLYEEIVRRSEGLGFGI